MRHKTVILLFLLLLPLSARAAEPDLSTRFKFWQESFDQSQIEQVKEHYNDFYFSEEELTNLFNSESQKAEKPFARDFKITLGDDSFKLQAFFLKVLRGKVYLEARVREDKIGFEVLKAKYYFIRIPAKWVETELNREIDE